MSHVGQHPYTDDGKRTMSRATSASPDARADHMGYLQRIRAFPVLTEDEEKDLIAGWYERGDRKAFDALIGSHLRLVPKIAQRYAGYGVPLGDLIGEGNLGLLQSAERFAPDKGFRFSTYARWWIKAAMLNFILQTWSLVKMGNGAGKKRLFFNLRRAKQNLSTDNNRYLSDGDISVLAKHFNVARGDIIAMDQRMSASDVSLHQTVPGSDGFTFGDMVADPAPNAEEIFIDADERRRHDEVLRDALAQLDRREKEIVVQRYLAKQPMTLAKLAKLYGLTAERVRQIEAKAIDKLRHYVRPRTRRVALGAI